MFKGRNINLILDLTRSSQNTITLFPSFSCVVTQEIVNKVNCIKNQNNPQNAYFPETKTLIWKEEIAFVTYLLQSHDNA